MMYIFFFHVDYVITSSVGGEGRLPDIFFVLFSLFSRPRAALATV